MSEFDVLKALSESGGEMEWSALMNTDKSVQETSGVLQMLLHNGYIAGPLSAHSSVKITSTGRARYLQLVRDLQEKHDGQEYIRSINKKMYKQGRYNAVIATISAILTLATLLVTIATFCKSA